jgi:hypothetical protein
MATYTNWGSLKRGLQKELRAAMEDALDLSKEAVYTETQVFYGGGTPLSYERTGAFGNTAERTEVYGSGDSLSGEVWMNGNYGYDTGSHPSGWTVFMWAEEGAAGIVGTTGTWERAEQQIKWMVDSAFADHFGRV